MLSTRKSMSNLMQTVEGPFIIHFRFWFETKFRENSVIKIQFGKRTLTPIKNYIPGEKQVIIDIASRSTMPICRVQVQSKAEIDLKKIQPGIMREHTVNIGKVKMVFVFQLLSNTSQIVNIYSNQKISQDEKYRYGQSVNDLIRSEAEFLAKFDKDNVADEIKKVQQQQIELQSKLSAELVQIKPIKFSIKNILLIFILFFIIGYLISSPSVQKKSYKKKIKPKKIKRI